MAQYLQNMQVKIKHSSSGLLLYFFKIFTGFMLGLTFALIGDEILSYGQFSFVFVVLLTIGGFLKVASPWRYTGVMVFNLVCILIGFLLQMYIKVAPGA